MAEKAIVIPPTCEPRRYIVDLQSRGVAVAKIAIYIGVTTRMVWHMKKFNHEPRWSFALKLIDLHHEHCSTATAQPSSFNSM